MSIKQGDRVRISRKGERYTGTVIERRGVPGKASESYQVVTDSGKVVPSSWRDTSKEK